MATPDTLPKTVLDQLARHDSPTIANVIELFDIRSRVDGFCSDSVAAVYPDLPPAVGYAVTCTFRSAYPAAGDAYAGMTAMISAGRRIKGPAIAVFQDLDDPTKGATYGELMATTLKTYGFAGLVTSGAARDIEQVGALDFPCWADGTIVSHGYCHFVDVGTPVNVAGLRINQGDLLHADGNGIIQIPKEIAAAVAELCDPYMEAEKILLDYLDTRKPSVAGYDRTVTEMGKAMDRLRSKARKRTT